MRVLLGIATLTTALLLGSTAPGVARPVRDDPTWRAADVGTDQQLRGLDAVDRDIAWVSGGAGGVWRTTDGAAAASARTRPSSPSRWYCALGR